MKAKHSGVFRITLRASESDLPAIVRLRQLLKVALRGFGFRCTDLEQVLDVPLVERIDDDEPVTTEKIVSA